MPRYIIIKLTDEESKTDYYFFWSTVFDAPVTYGMTLPEFTDFYRSEYGEDSMRAEFPERMNRVEKTGTSAWGEKLEQTLACNRAGPGELTLSKEELIEKYCRKPKKEG